MQVCGLTEKMNVCYLLVNSAAAIVIFCCQLKKKRGQVFMAKMLIYKQALPKTFYLDKSKHISIVLSLVSLLI
jgi:hypothetical protein